MYSQPRILPGKYVHGIYSPKSSPRKQITPRPNPTPVLEKKSQIHNNVGVNYDSGQTNLTPCWFLDAEPSKIDVSIIIPMFRSAKEICKQIEFWDLSSYDGLTKEIIYVDDGCPDDSSGWAIRSWDNLRNKWNGMKSICGNYKGYIGKVIKLNKNCGFSTACNIGSCYSKGNNLIFLHPDVIVTSNWIDPLIKAIDKGIIGNLQLREDGKILSAGKTWMEDSRTFEENGRDVWNKKRLQNLMTEKDIGKNLIEVDAIGSCCMAMTKKTFDDCGNFDSRYKYSCWEDVDFCMRAKQFGKKCYVEPNSIIYHKEDHSDASCHPFVVENSKLFYQKWSKL